LLALTDETSSKVLIRVENVFIVLPPAYIMSLTPEVSLAKYS